MYSYKMAVKPTHQSVECMIYLSLSSLSPPISIPVTLSVFIQHVCLQCPMCFHVCSRHMSQSKRTIRQPWYFLLLALVSKDTFYSSSILSLPSVFCCEYINIYTKQSYAQCLKLCLIQTHFISLTTHSLLVGIQPNHLKGMDLHLTSEITLYFLCVFQKSQWSTPQLW